MNNNRLSQNFNAYTLIKFTFPTTIMLIFMSLYQMVDGIFVANFVGENALSALNIVYPCLLYTSTLIRHIIHHLIDFIFCSYIDSPCRFIHN